MVAVSRVSKTLNESNACTATMKAPHTPTGAASLSFIVAILATTFFTVTHFATAEEPKKANSSSSEKTVAEPKPRPPATPKCNLDLKGVGPMEDIISNVLTRAENKPLSEVQPFLRDARKRSATGDDLLKAAAEHYKMDEKKLAALVEHWRHINCKHAAIPGYAVPDAERDATGIKPARAYDIRRGSLVLCGAGEFPDDILKSFAHLARVEDSTSDQFLMVFSDNPKQRAFKTLKSLVGDKVELVDCSSDDSLRKIPDGIRERVKKCSGVWLDLTSPPSAEKYAALMVREVFEQGTVVGAAGTWASQMLSISEGSPWAGLQLIPHCRMNPVKEEKLKSLEAAPLEKGMVHWLVPDETALILPEGRTATSHGNFPVRMVIPPSKANE